MGVMCSVCRDVLVPDRCPECKQRHGYTYQQPSEWAAKTWPEHACFSA